MLRSSAAQCRYSLRPLQYRRCLDLDPRAVLEESFALDHTHRGEGPTDDLTIGGPQWLLCGEVFAFVDHVPRHAHDVARRPAGLANERRDGHQRLARLRHEIIAIQPALRVPPD